MIKAQNIIRNFQTGEVITKVLKGISLEIKNGEFVAIIGPSGSGKSTLLYNLSLLDSPTSGDVYYQGKKTSDLTDSEKVSLRLNSFGFVFQSYANLPELTAIENVALPCLMAGYSTLAAEAKAAETLAKFGLSESLYKLPSQLSGGQQQRVSIARAIVLDPEIVFADEPTASLDGKTSREVMNVFAQLHKNGQTIVMITHEMVYAKMAERIIEIDDGQIK